MTSFPRQARALFGDNAARALSDALQVRPRTASRWLAGEEGPPQSVIEWMQALTDAQPAYAFDDWGEAVIVMRLRHPRFVAHVIEGTSLEGLVWSLDDDHDICNFVWLDPCPDEATQVRLIGETRDAIDKAGVFWCG